MDIHLFEQSDMDNLLSISNLQALRAQSDQHMWMSNNRLLENVGLGLGNMGQGASASQGGQQQQGAGNMNANDWASALSLNLQPIYSQLAQQ